MTATVVTLGEMLMRLKPPGKQRLRQAQSFEVCHGGAEANVAVSLAEFGLSSRFITALPEGELGAQALRFLRAHNVDTSCVARRAGRLGLYFMEEGADFRSGCVVYDRAESVFADWTPNAINWDDAFKGADWFHISGITPAISHDAYTLGRSAMEEARNRGIHVSLDLNYRDRLWQYGKAASQVMPELIPLADTLIAGRGDCINCLGVDGDGENGSDDWATSLTEKLATSFHQLKFIALTVRNSESAERHTWRGHLRTSEAVHVSRTYNMTAIVDRVGTGDAFCAGLIYGLLDERSDSEALEFAAAANCLKHSIAGDSNAVTVEEVDALRTTTSFGILRR
ncbi:MAG: sugar kinase [Pseudomonadota bacterium]